MTAYDLIDRLATGEEHAAHVSDLRRPVAKQQAQQSYDALFSPVDDKDFPVEERWLVAAFATRLTADDTTAQYYAGGARGQRPEVADAVIAVAAQTSVPGPYGNYPEPGLADESRDGLRYVADSSEFGERLAAALTHTHLLVKRPREVTGVDHQRLLDAGWSTDGIVTLSQLISFLAFQQRVAGGLRVLAEEASA